MSTLLIVVMAIFFLFAIVVFFGAPYLPTLKNRVNDALDLLDLKPGQTLLELGSGDGRMLKAAAQRGIKSVGYELNPLLVLCSILSTWRYREYVTVKYGDYWRSKWPESDGMYVFLLDRYMKKLDKHIVRYRANRPYKLVSFAFKIPNRKPLKEVRGMYLYKYKL